MPKPIKGYKAYNKGLICKGVKFEENKIYETPEAKVCEKGFHLCINPLDVLNYYDLIDSEFTEAEALGKIDRHKEDSKIATTKIKIGAKLSLKAFIEASVNFLLEVTKNKKTESGDFAQIGSSGYSAQIGSSGDFAKIGSSGYSAKIGSSGYSAKIGSSGYSAQIGSSGDFAQIGSSGDSAKIGSSGYSAKIGSSGDSAKIGSSGYSAKIGSSGYSAQIGSSGDSAQIGSSGDSAQIELNGQDSVGAGIGLDTKIKGKKGNWITLAEWKYDDEKKRYVPICVKSAQIDGEIIKEDTFYMLKDSKFTEVINGN